MMASYYLAPLALILVFYLPNLDIFVDAESASTSSWIWFALMIGAVIFSIVDLVRAYRLVTRTTYIVTRRELRVVREGREGDERFFFPIDFTLLRLDTPLYGAGNLHLRNKKRETPKRNPVLRSVPRARSLIELLERLVAESKQEALSMHVDH